jgi:hypothetical protein
MPLPGRNLIEPAIPHPTTTVDPSQQAAGLRPAQAAAGLQQHLSSALITGPPQAPSMLHSLAGLTCRLPPCPLLSPCLYGPKMSLLQQMFSTAGLEGRVTLGPACLPLCSQPPSTLHSSSHGRVWGSGFRLGAPPTPSPQRADTPPPLRADNPPLHPPPHPTPPRCPVLTCCPVWLQVVTAPRGLYFSR